MILNYLKIALRNLIKHKAFALINILGLSVGLAATMLLLTFIRHELSYEAMHENRERIYRTIARVDVSKDETMVVPAASGEVHDWLLNEMPEVEHVVRMDPLRVRSVKYNKKEFRDFDGYMVDTEFFQVFSLQARQGNLKTALNGPGKMVITKDFANRLFGDANPLNKTVEAGGDEYTISAVIEQLPPNTFLDFDCLVSFANIENQRRYFANRGVSVATFIQFKEGTMSPQLKTKARELIENRTNELLTDGIEVAFSLQALEDMHLHSSHLDYDLANTGSMRYIYIFGALAVLILLIAIINYINLETARAEKRGREVGMRKVNGASRGMLISQFLGEALLLAFVSFLMAYLIVEVSMPSFEKLLQREFENALHQPVNILLFAGIAVATGVLSGMYPAFYLSAYNPTRIFQAAANNRGSNALRAALVVVQFSIAAFLIMSLLVVYHQINYLKGKELGFDRDQVLVIDNVPSGVENSLQSIRQELENYPQVKSVSFSMSYPGNISTHNKISLSVEQSGVLSKTNRVDANYKDVMGFEMTQGRYFSPNRATDSAAYVINQRAADMLGLEAPIGKTLYYNNEDPGPIIGVLKDYHMEPLRSRITPVVHQLITRYNNIVVRFDPQATNEVVNIAEKVLKNYGSNYRMEYEFLDRYFAEMYRQEERMNKMGLIGSGLAIFIAVLGLFAMASYIVISQRRAIGIRKALGATRITILRMLMLRIHRWVLISFVIAAPVAYFIMQKWLANFAYRIDVSAWHLIGGAVIVLLISVLTILYQTLNAARINPADTLRDE